VALSKGFQRRLQSGEKERLFGAKYLFKFIKAILGEMKSNITADDLKKKIKVTPGQCPYLAGPMA